MFSDESRSVWQPALRRLILDWIASELRRRDAQIGADTLIAVKEPIRADAA